MICYLVNHLVYKMSENSDKIFIPVSQTWNLCLQILFHPSIYTNIKQKKERILIFRGWEQQLSVIFSLKNDTKNSQLK